MSAPFPPQPDGLFDVDPAQIVPAPAKLSPEEWRPVVGYEGDYEISSEGRVRARRRSGSSGGLLKVRPDAKGYPMLSLMSNGVHATRRVHRLIAEAFIGPIPKGAHVRHLDGNPAHTVLANIAIGTPSENHLDRVAHGRDVNANKTHCPKNHPYDDVNTYRTPSRPAARYCRECQKERRRKREPTPPKPCGTRAAYARHLRHGEEPCGACRAANAERTRNYMRAVSDDAARWVPEAAT